jgi:serine/threonine protein kinase
MSVQFLEEVLSGGTTNAGLVTRVGDTVRRPLSEFSTARHALLDHLEAVGFEGAPRYLGIDERGREILSYVHGRAIVKPYPPWALSDAALVSVARLLRDYHDAVASFEHRRYQWPHPLPQRFRGSVVCHNDLNLDNIVFSSGRAVALIDFDLAGPGCVGWDLAGCVRLWAPFEADPDRPTTQRRSLERLALFADAFGATPAEREDLVEAMVPCHDWSFGIVRDAVQSGHPAFRQDWIGGGERRAETTRRWLLTNNARMRSVLGLEDSRREHLA